MTFLDIQNQVTTISNVQNQTDLVKKSIQIALNRIVQYHEWPFYTVNTGLIQTVAQYTTGTANVTNGSTAVTGTSTVWTSAMVGRKIRFQNDNAYYRISAVGSATSITLTASYQGTTNTAATYSLYKDEYRLASDVDTYKTIIQIQNSVPMSSIPPSVFDSYFPTPFSYASPYIEIMEGTVLDIYTTGTVTVTINSSTITGSGTSWTTVEGLGRMTPITVGTNVYTVKSVTNDTTLVIYEVPTVAAAAGTSYTLNMTNLKVQLFPIPSVVENEYYRYHRIPDILVNSYDVPDLPYQWQYLLIYGSLSFLFMQKGDINQSENVAEARFIEGLQNMKKKLGSYAVDRKWRVRPQGVYTSSGDGLEKGTFDRRWSMP